MNKIIGLLIIILFALVLAQVSFVSCTDVGSDGIDSIYYPGSTLPQTTSYRNPVWEPDFELGTVFKGASNYTAIGSETQWATGITYCAPILISNNLMDWRLSLNTGFPLMPDSVFSGGDTTIYKRPDWVEGRVHSMTAGFTRTIPGTSYWLFYQLGDTPAIGVAAGRSSQGPYSDFGQLINNTNTGSQTLSDPFFFVKGTSYYLYFSSENGSYVQELKLKRSEKPTLSGDPKKVSGNGFNDVAIYRKGDFYYLFGTVTNNSVSEIYYGRSNDATGPFVDASGTDLRNGGGTLLVKSGSRLINPNNISGVFPDFNEDDFILYNVTDIETPLLASGYNRRPMLLNKLEFTADGWISGIIEPQIGWSAPKFIDKE